MLWYFSFSSAALDSSLLFACDKIIFLKVIGHCCNTTHKLAVVGSTIDALVDRVKKGYLMLSVCHSNTDTCRTPDSYYVNEPPTHAPSRTATKPSYCYQKSRL